MNNEFEIKATTDNGQGTITTEWLLARVIRNGHGWVFEAYAFGNWHITHTCETRELMDEYINSSERNIRSRTLPLQPFRQLKSFTL